MKHDNFLQSLKGMPQQPIAHGGHDLPRYSNNFILDRDASGLINVYDCEDYHAGNFDRIRFTTNELEHAISYTTGQNGPLSDCFPRNGFIRWFKFTYYIHKVLTKPTQASGGTSHRKIEFAGWLTPFVDTNVGDHPVFNFTRFPPKGYYFTRNAEGRKVSYWKLLPLFYSCILTSIRMLRKGVPYSFIIRFWYTRRIDKDYLRLPVGAKHVVLYPSYSFLSPFHSWAIEIEDVTTLTVPFIPYGSPNPEITREHPAILALETLLESKKCKAVICHLEATANGLRTLFKDTPSIPPKIKHIPLGWHLPEPMHRKRGSKKQINILFLNGWAQDPGAFFRRGGLTTLEAFSQISREFDNVRLIIRSHIPHLNEKYSKILKDQKVLVLAEKMPVSQLTNLYKQCDILAFPAPRVAVTTLLQAMSYSLAIVAADGFGIEEYVKDGVNGLIARGYYGQSGWFDLDGIFRENYLTCLEYNPTLVENTANALRRLITDNDLRFRMQAQARDYLEKHFTMGQWNSKLAPVLDELFDARNKASPSPETLEDQNRLPPVRSPQANKIADWASVDDHHIASPHCEAEIKGRLDSDVNIEFGGWLPAFDRFGRCGTHPLFSHVEAPPKGYRFIRSRESKGSASEYLRRFIKLGRGAFSLLRAARGCGARVADVLHFLRERDWRQQMKLPSNTRMLYLPSVPYTFGQFDWMIEIEDTNSLFFPFIANGQTFHQDVLSHPAYPIIKALLASTRCRGIVTHMRSTAESLPLLFQLPELSEKVHYIPLGIKSLATTRDSTERKGIRILFTNSWHQDEGNFYVRGGIDALEAFRRLRLKYSGLELIVRSQLPSDLAEFFPDYRRVIDEAGVQVFQSRMDDASWRELLQSCDIFLLPAARIHVVSILEAMSYGMVVVASDGWGITEYVQHGVNGIVVPGRYGKTSWIDGNGVLREHYKSMGDGDAGSTPMRAVDECVVDGLCREIANLIEDPDLRQRLGANARNVVATEFSLDRWNRRFKSVLDGVCAARS